MDEGLRIILIVECVIVVITLCALVPALWYWYMFWHVWHLGRPKRPQGRMTITLVKESSMPDADILEYRVEIPPISDADAEQQRLVVEEDGIMQEPQILPKDAREAFFVVKQGRAVQLFLSYLDDGDPPNEGPRTSTDAFIANDTIPPGAPGPFGEIRLINELPADPGTPSGPDEPAVEPGPQGPQDVA